LHHLDLLVGIVQRNVWACGQKPRGGWIRFL